MEYTRGARLVGNGPMENNYRLPPSAAHEVHERLVLSSRYITASEVGIRPEREMQ